MSVADTTQYHSKFLVSLGLLKQEHRPRAASVCSRGLNWNTPASFTGHRADDSTTGTATKLPNWRRGKMYQNVRGRCVHFQLGSTAGRRVFCLKWNSFRLQSPRPCARWWLEAQRWPHGHVRCHLSIRLVPLPPASERQMADPKSPTNEWDGRLRSF